MLDNELSLDFLCDTNSELLSYFNNEFKRISSQQLLLKNDLFEIKVEVSELEKKRDIYKISNNNQINMFSPIKTDSPLNSKINGYNSQIIELRNTQSVLEDKIVDLEKQSNLINNYINKINLSNEKINDYFNERMERIEEFKSSFESDECDGFEFIELDGSNTNLDKNVFSNKSNEDRQHNYNVLMLWEYQKLLISKNLNAQVVENITSINHKLEVIKWMLNSDINRARVDIEEIIKYNDEIANNISCLANNLNGVNNDANFINNITSYVEYLNKNVNNINFKLEVTQQNFDLMIQPIFNSILFRIIEELLNNTITHSKCKEVSIKINTYDNRINFNISDNGIGISEDYMEKSLWYSGLHFIKEWLYLLDGSVDIKGDILSGTNVEVNVPVY